METSRLGSLLFLYRGLILDTFGKDGITALLHEPTRGAGGTTDADGLDALQP